MKAKIYNEFKASFCEPIETEQKRFRWYPLYSGGECDVDGFEVPAIADLETLVIDPDPPALLEHDPDCVVGKLENVEIITDESGRLAVVCDAVIGGTQYAADVIRYAKEGPVNLKPSIGIKRIRDYNIEYVDAGRETRVNGRVFRGPVAIVRNGHLVEGSFVTLAGDPEAKSFSARMKGYKKMSFDEFLKNKEITPEMFDALTVEEKEALRVEYESITGEAAADVAAEMDKPDELTAEGEAEAIETIAADSEEAIKEAVKEAVIENIDQMEATEAAETFLEIAAETVDEIGAECGGDKEELKASAKRIARRKVKERLFKAALKRKQATAAGSALNESRRVSGIKSVCASYGRKGAEIAGKAIANGWSYSKTEKALKAGFANGNKLNSLSKFVPGSTGPTQGRPSRADVLTAAFAMTCRLKPDYVKKHFGFSDSVMNAAMERPNRHVSIKRLIHESINSFKPGYAQIDSPMLDLLPTMRALCKSRHDRELQPGFNAAMGFSTISATDILKAIIEAYLLDQEEAAPTFYRNIVKEKVNPDFNTIDAYLPTLIGQLTKISETGQIEHVGYTTQKISAQTEPLGATFAIPEMVLINDQLSAFVDLLEQFRELPEKCVEHDTAKLFWRMVDGDVTAYDGNAFFSTGRGNVITGSSYVLSETGLAKATEVMDNMTDANGYPLSSEGAFIVTNSTLYPTAQRLFVSENLNVIDTVGDRNVFAGVYEPKKWAMLNPGLARAKKDDGSTNSDLVTYAASQWYMIRSPQRRPIISLNKLAGYESPQIRQFDADPSVWGTIYQLIYPYSVTPMFPDGAIVMRGA